MFDKKCVYKLRNMSNFSRDDLMRAMQTCQGSKIVGDATFKARLNSLLNDGRIARIGRNAYIVPEQHMRQYHYAYSDLSNDVANLIIKKHPFLTFSIFELVQLNEFVNHQLAHNVVFVSVESNLGDFVFETLKEAFPGRVLINPTLDLFHQYWMDNVIVIRKLASEAPKGNKQSWHTRLEKLLVDLMSDPLLMDSISQGELPGIYEEAFSRYVIDESHLFRYAKRRTADKRIKQFIHEKTMIKLRIS